MSEFSEEMKKIPGFRYLGGVSKEKVNAAEKQLGLSFSNDYREYLESFGLATFGSIELTGIVDSKRLNVVDVTLMTKSANPDIPSTMYVVETTDFEGLEILQDSNGKIFEFKPFEEPKCIYNTFEAYIKSITA